jgi:hypothetical protein
VSTKKEGKLVWRIESGSFRFAVTTLGGSPWLRSEFDEWKWRRDTCACLLFNEVAVRQERKQERSLEAASLIVQIRALPINIID